MRSDMAKVVTESPRRGHGNRSRKWGRRLSKDEFELDDHGSTRAPIARHSQYGWDAKEFSDLLGPLRGYLRKQVGRPWDKVWSELSANLDKRSITGSHIFDHIRMEVEIECWQGESGTIYRQSKYGSSPPVYGLYVHPMTGVLCYIQPQRYRDEAYRKKRAFQARLMVFPGLDYDGAIRFRIADEWTVWERQDAGWFRLTYREKDPQTIVRTRMTKSGEEIVTRLGPGHKELVAVRQASKKDVRRARALLERAPF